MKKVTTVFDTRKIDQLRNHPLNAKVFGELAKDGVDAEFVESVRQHGILQPIVITKDNLILSGHRRRQAAARAGLKEVPVIVRHDLNGGIESDFAWFETNRNREMTVEQRAKWYEVRAKIEELAAKERKAAAGGDKRVENSENSAEKALGKNLPKRSPKAKDIAAAEAGMSRPTAEKAVEVVHAIDEAEAAGDVERAEDLRTTLNERSVAEAHRKATGKAKAKEPEPESPTPMLDALNRAVPKGLEAEASAAAALSAIGRKLDPLKRELEGIAQTSGGRFVDMTDANRLFRELKNCITQARYWTSCPRCSGKGCERCSESGWIPFAKRGQLSADDKVALGVE